tara:strand:+ start:7355 stop:7636 length:282 start_codon:yes stop_codon:yes gene_type:complete
MEHPEILSFIIALIGSAGFWSFISMREKQKSLTQSAYTDTLVQQVERLAARVDTMTADKELLLREIAELRADLGEAQTTIKHLEEMLRHRNAT